MKRVLILSAVGLASFAAGTAGIYLAMPSFAPEVVEHTRERLDSLGLIQTVEPDEMAPPPSARRTATRVLAMEATSLEQPEDEAAIPAVPTFDDVVIPLEDSLARMNVLVRELESNKSTLNAQIADLKKRLEAVDSQHVEATEMSKSVTRLEDDQLGGVLAALDFNVIEILYMQASARDRTRMLQNMAPDRAARFVRTLVRGPAPANDVASTNQE